MNELLKTDIKFLADKYFLKWLWGCIIAASSSEERIQRLIMLSSVFTVASVSFHVMYSNSTFITVAFLIVIETVLFNLAVSNFEYQRQKRRMWENLKRK